ncbi:MAG: hypothetical protein QOJ65_2047 [Fimbriimonadaceae bacterium]|jgi:hypothetical protein|nr:hypothetical protein [Fimbriimonadaceae bacterium]
MQFFVIGPDGGKYGPADVETLKQWAVENRLGPQTMLEDFNTGQRMPASAVQGLFEGQGAATATAQPGQMNPPGLYENPPTPAYYGRPGNASGDDGSKELTLSFVFLVLSFFCCWPIFAPLGIINANKATQKGNPTGNIARILNIVVLVLGIVAVVAYIILLIVGIAGGGLTPR